MPTDRVISTDPFRARVSTVTSWRTSLARHLMMPKGESISLSAEVSGERRNVTLGHRTSLQVADHCRAIAKSRPVQ